MPNMLKHGRHAIKGEKMAYAIFPDVIFPFPDVGACLCLPLRKEALVTDTSRSEKQGGQTTKNLLQGFSHPRTRIELDSALRQFCGEAPRDGGLELPAPNSNSLPLRFKCQVLS